MNERGLQQRADPCGHDDQIGLADAAITELLNELDEQRVVPVDDPTRDLLITGPRRVLNQDMIILAANWAASSTASS